MHKEILKKPVYYAAALLTLIFCYVLVADSQNVKTGIYGAVERCLNIIIPSLFAFMAMSNLLIDSGLYSYILKPFKIIYKYIMHMPESLFFVFLMGNIAGYPVGISLLSQMVNTGKISKQTAEKFSCVVCCGGPAFYVGTIGLGIFHSVKIGAGVFLSIVAANCILACIICRIFKFQSSDSCNIVSLDSNMFVNSVLKAGKSLFTICTMIVFFAAVMSVITYMKFFDSIKELSFANEMTVPLVKSFLEITAITEIKNMPYSYLPVITGICSFGGVCVLLQIIAVNGKKFSLKYFYLSRFINFGLSALMFNFLKKYFIPYEVSAVSMGEQYLCKFNNFIPSICLILMILLLKCKKGLVISE